MKRELWINWEDRYFFYDEIPIDYLLEKLIDICFEEIPGFEFYGIFVENNGAELQKFLGTEKFEEYKERIINQLDYYEI